jgi:hypothetical protein
MIYHATLATTRGQLQSAGYLPGAEAYGNANGLVITGERDSNNIWFHLIAKKPLAPLRPLPGNA